MHITILALGSYGDIQPYASLGKGLINAGHQVRFITFESFSTIVNEYGLDFFPIQGDARALVASAGPQMISLIRRFGSLAKSYTRDLSSPAIGETDLIINQLPAGLLGYDLGECYGIPMVLASVIPLTPTRFSPMIGFPHLPSHAYNRFSYFVGEQMAWQMFRSTINNWRATILNLPPIPWKGYLNKLRTPDYPVLNGFSPQVVPRPDDWGEYVHVTGYWLPSHQAWEPPAALRDFIQAGSPPVFVGFGSMPVKDPAKTTRLILDTMREVGQRCVLHSGWSEVGKYSLPENVYPIDYVPYDWLFPQMAMVIHHGGSGTTAAVLQTGVPSCVVPFVFDQFYWGERIAALKVGPDPIPFKNLSAEKLGKAVNAGIHDGRIRQNARNFGQQLRKEDGITRAIEVIESL